MIYYSAKNNGFYTNEIHGNNIPSDAVEITIQEHVALLDAQSSGKTITADENGFPIANDPPAPTIDQIRENLSSIVQNMLDETARERNYDGIVSACSYIASANPKFSDEAMACVLWRDAVWATCYDLLDQVMRGEMAIPTEDELLDLLPKMEWPS